MMFKKPVRPVERVFVHCSASGNKAHDDVSVIEAWHKERWPTDCANYAGYHYFIKSDGTLQTSRPLEVKPVAQAKHNSHTIAICLHGLKESDFTEKQFDTLRELCKQIDLAYKSTVTFHGHCEVAPKSCPVFNYRKVLSLDVLGRLFGEGKHVLTQQMPTLKLGSTGDAVRRLQFALQGVVQTGTFDEATRKAVVSFQSANKLDADGIVGKKTWAALLN